MFEDFSTTLKIFLTAVFILCSVFVTVMLGNVGAYLLDSGTSNIKEGIMMYDEDYTNYANNETSITGGTVNGNNNKVINAETYIEDNSIINEANNISYQPFLIVCTILMSIVCIIHMVFTHIKNTREYTERLLNINLNNIDNNDELLSKYK